MATPLLTFENAVMRLQRFWHDEGCLLVQPMNSEVGAGTMNPNTFLRVLGPAPWSVAYVEPSVRPDDSRYGDNPNRIQTHTQFQVILKPDPGDPQERYLRSLRAIGIDTAAHDVRFVEDNWESPALGAWGLGWEVWLDGLEITQFTYFQQAGGFALDPVSVEITYGIERILMALQGVDHFKQIAYSDRHSYGELLGKAELELSTYYLDAANVARVREMAAMYEAEADEMLERELVLPAYTYVLKLSHAFNILDARGGIGVTERAAFFARMRNLSRRCAELWAGTLDVPEERPDEAGDPLPIAPSSPAAVASPAIAAPLVVEVGTEELPPADLDDLILQTRRGLPAMLAEVGLGHGAVTVEGTPRRIVMSVAGLETTQPLVRQRKRGPRADIAWSPDGAPTKAAIGFAKRNGVPVEALERESVDGVELVVADVREGGRSSIEVLSDNLPRFLATLRVRRSMRWNATGTAFSRPIRWLLALHGDRVVPVRFAGVEAAAATRLLRTGEREEDVPVASASAHAQTVERAGIVIDRSARRALITAELDRLCAEVGAQPHPEVTPRLLDEVVNLIEAPRVFLGSFEQRYLELPQEALITVMVKHQRYFPLVADGKLVPHFAFVVNGERDAPLVRRGNEAVLRARYADAEFFYAQDTSRPLEAYHERLDRMTFHERLGSMSDKVERVSALVRDLGRAMDLSASEQRSLERAALLSKDDLGTSLVMELSSLAGVMGGHYALLSDESQEVADAIADHVKPVSAGAPLPRTHIGAVLAVADRLDTLIALMAAGVTPSGTTDPFGLRRAANGLIEIVTFHALPLDLAAAVALHQRNLPSGLDAPATEILDWVYRRLEVVLREDDRIPADLARASIGGSGADIATKRAVARELAQVVSTQQWAELAEALQRAGSLARQLDGEVDVDPARFTEPAEAALWKALLEVEEPAGRARSVRDLVTAVQPMIGRIHSFFEDVFVMVDDEQTARNRLALLARVARLGSQLVDVSQLQRARVAAAD